MSFSYNFLFNKIPYFLINIQNIQDINNIRLNPIASVLLSSDQKRNVLEKKVLDLKTEALRLTLEQTNNLILESLQRLEPDEGLLRTKLTDRRTEIQDKMRRNSRRLADLSLELSTNTLALMNSDSFNPVFILASLQIRN